MNKVLCCIPARLASSRLYAKPLLKINDKTIINLVYDQVLKVKNISKVIVLTDSQVIYDEVYNFGGNVEIITEECLNGTERIIKYLQKTNTNNYDIILNVQGDEPFINPEDIDKLVENYISNKEKNDNMVCSTLYYETNDTEEIFSRSRGKIVLNKNNYIMYCSRNIIPATKKSKYNNTLTYKINIGIFVYNKNYLLNHFIKENTELQLLEDIEWMKILEQGYDINAIKVNCAERGVDTIDDYNFLVGKYQK
jgi:3-deoxy-manno-octulosonate cytidylyltransferase (CMP-KDO synthetase)